MRLYKDAFNQLKLIGIIGVIILCAEAVITPIGTYISYHSGTAGLSPLPSSVSFIDIHFLLIFTFIIAAPLFTLYLFNFLNKRNASDFYHSIPYSRKTFFLAYFAAIASWLFIMIFLSSFLVITASLFMKNYYILNIANALITSFNMFAGSLFVCSCIAIAMCITGTIFNNIIVSGLILFVPRIIITVVLNGISSVLPLVSSNNFVPLLDVKYNVVSGAVFSLFTGSLYDLQTSLNSFSSGVYTFIMAVILMIVGMLLFMRRKSDSAGFSAPNKFLQAAYRIIIALIVCLLPIYMIFQNIANKNSVTGSTLFEYFIEYLAAVFLYFLYEIITTRKWKSLIKAIPSLLILAALNIVILAGMYGIYKNVLSFTPKTDEVQSVQILSSENASYTSDDILYFTKSAEEIKLDNPVIKQVICDNLRDSVNTINDSLSKYQKAHYSSTVKTVAIHTGLRTYYRNIVLSDRDLQTIAKELSQNEAYKEAYLELPQLGKPSTTVSLSNVSLSEQSTKLIYNTLREEVKSLGFEKWYSILNQYSWKDESYYLDTIILDGAVGFNNYSASIPLDTALKNTCNLYFQEVNKANSKNLENLLTLLNSKYNGKYQFSIDITPYNFDMEYVIPTYYDYGDGENSLFTFSAEQTDALINLFKTSQDNTPTTDSPFLAVNVWYTDMDTYEGENYTLFIAAAEPSDLELIRELSR